MDSRWEGAHQTSRHPQGPCIGNQLHREDDIAVESSMSEDASLVSSRNLVGHLPCRATTCSINVVSCVETPRCHAIMRLQRPGSVGVNSTSLKTLRTDGPAHSGRNDGSA
ncbi:hypothetical protein DY000_02047150 [Brassica cretica]|uniref:Uncharacterized protein n=1 Tax=Brassica cretica TaxID=69181 RepID=A0ABQ7F2I3_BRACR|nr:hypothetical protein DY000_02047150 [Brassica cretica]